MGISTENSAAIVATNGSLPALVGTSIAPGVDFKITRLAPVVQHELAQEEKVTGPLVREYQSAGQQAARLSVPGLEEIFEPRPQATYDDVLALLSNETLQAILAKMPVDEHFAIWRAKVKKASMARLSVSAGLFGSCRDRATSGGHQANNR